jgi:hypothetical protein
MNSNKIVRITESEITFSDIEDDEDFCPFSYFQSTEDGRKKLKEFYTQNNL